MENRRTGSVNIESYDGEEGYIKGDSEKKEGTTYKGRKYLVDTKHVVASNYQSGAWRVVRDNIQNHSARGIPVKDSNLIKKLERKISKDDEKIVDEYHLSLLRSPLSVIC